MSKASNEATIVTTIRIKKSTKQALDRAAESEDRSLNNYVGRILDNHVKKLK